MQIEIIYLVTSGMIFLDSFSEDVNDQNSIFFKKTTFYPIKYVKWDGHPKHAFAG